MPKKQPLVIVLLGPTASGKTELAIEIAQQLNLSIHNIDSRQVYVGMDIGTAKPNKEQLLKIHHYLIDLKQPNQPITLKEFQSFAQESLNQTINATDMAFLVGGSGLYLKAITKGLLPPAVPPQQDLRKQLGKLGQNVCFELLKSADPKSAKRISRADYVRTQRALEVLYSTGRPMSLQQGSNPPPWRILEIGLNPNNLRQRIAQRTEKLYKNGLIEETRELQDKFGSDLPMLQTIGYKEALEVIQNKSSINEAISITNRRTRQFAKRQRTWFRRQHNPHWLSDEEPLREAVALIKTVLG